MNCYTEPIGNSIYQYGLPIILLMLLTCGIICFLCKISWQLGVLNIKQKVKRE